MDPNGPFFLIFRNIVNNSLIYISLRDFNYSLLKIHRKLTSAYLLCVKAALNSNKCGLFEFKYFMNSSGKYRTSQVEVVVAKCQERSQTWVDFFLMLSTSRSDAV
jgi:hypothetical protein